MTEVITCTCHDGSIPPVIAKRAPSGWKLFALSAVHGLGDGEYNLPLDDIIYDEIIALNEFRGISHIALRTGNDWKLIQLIQREGRSLYADWKYLDGESKDLGTLFKKHGLDENGYIYKEEIKILRKRATALIERDGRFLLVREGDKRIYSLPGGGVRSDEGLMEAAIREAREELGVIALSATRTPELDYRGRYQHHNVSLIDIGDQNPEIVSEIKGMLWYRPGSRLKKLTHVDAILEKYISSSFEE